jgi:hypothetical protein
MAHDICVMRDELQPKAANAVAQSCTSRFDTATSSKSSKTAGRASAAGSWQASSLSGQCRAGVSRLRETF